MVPSWVPEGARHYLAHTESGASIRDLARRAGKHASTVLRQIRAFETRRDDLLVDEALRRLGGAVSVARPAGSPPKECRMTLSADTNPDRIIPLSETRLRQEARRVLRRLCERGALLAVAAEMDKAVVVRETEAGTTRTAVVDRDVAEALALKAWIACDAPGRISRYHVTARGRAALGEILAEEANAATGLREPATILTDDETAARPARLAPSDTPLAALARRREKDGTPFLTPDLVRAGERLREDFELAQMAPRMAQNWDHFLTHVDDGGAVPEPTGYGAEAARARLIGALRDLGPGLGDVVLRCCCYLQGLETAERKMGWSARSAKIVLRIALCRLKRHYERLGTRADLIG
ncbi:MAG: helix-turn-helix domain containing protein [Roseovarius sp.]|nr:helix-turn-helix domain containing protein [Roseovarius sp.]